MVLEVIPVLYSGSGLDVNPAVLLPPIATGCRKLGVRKRRLRLICIDPLDSYKGSGYWSDINVKISLTGKYVQFFQMKVEEYKRPSSMCVHLPTVIKGSVTGLELVKPGERVLISSNNSIEFVNLFIKNNYPKIKHLTEDDIVNFKY